MKVNCEGAECDLLDRLLESGELKKVDHLLVQFDIEKIPSMSHRAKETRARLDASGVEWREGTSIMFGRSHSRRTANWLAWCEAVGWRRLRCSVLNRAEFPRGKPCIRSSESCSDLTRLASHERQSPGAMDVGTAALSGALRRLLRPLRRDPRLQRILARTVPKNLDLLARIYRTDKSSNSHGYTQWYAHHLHPRRREVRSVLEIGIGGITSRRGYDTEFGGMSLRMWRDYFPKARIVGIDIEKKVVTGKRISVEQGSQDDPVFLRDIALRYGPFDVVIDDGSHVGRHVRASFQVLFEHVRPGGIYVIEDLATAYLEGWEGGPPGTPGTQAELIKPLVDDVLRRHWNTDGTARPIAALHLYDQIVFIEKARP